MLDLFPEKPDYSEPGVAFLLGVSRQTLRNMRVGYKTAAGTYPPRLTEGVEWYKLRNSRRAPVMFDPAWVEKQLEIKRIKENQ